MKKEILRFLSLGSASAAVWLLTAFFPFYTPFTVEVRGKEANFILWDQLLTLQEVVGAPFNLLEVSLSDSPFSTAFSSGVLLIDQKKEVFLPKKKSPPSKGLSLGDWYIDHPEEHTVLQYQLTPPTSSIVLKGKVEGRSLSFHRVRLKGNDEYTFEFRRGFLSHDFSISRNGKVLASAIVDPPYHQTLLGIAALGLQIFLLHFLISTAVQGILLLSPCIHEQKDSSFPFTQGLPLVVLLISLLFFSLTLYGSWKVLAGLPHFQDDFGYLLRAKWLLQGKVYEEVSTKLLPFLELPHFFWKENAIKSIYPIGWPALLSLGEYFSVPWILPPLCGTATVLLTYLIGKELFGRATGTLGAALFALSPLTQVLSSSLLSHAGMGLFITLHCYFLLRALREEKIWWGVISGLSLGWSFGVRPLTALAVGSSTAGYVLTVLVIKNRAITGHQWKVLTFSFFSAALGVLPCLIDNAFVTGDPFLFAYTVGQGHHWRLDNIQHALPVTESTLSLLFPMMTDWGYSKLGYEFLFYIPFGFLVFPLVSQDKGVQSYFLLLLFLALPLAYIGHDGSGLHGFGPRFYYETTFALCLLIGRGIELTYTMLSRASYRMPRQLFTAALLLFIIINSWSSVPRLTRYQGYNDVTSQFPLSPEKDTVYFLTKWTQFLEAAPCLSGGLTTGPALFLLFNNKTPISSLPPSSLLIRQDNAKRFTPLIPSIAH